MTYQRRPVPPGSVTPLACVVFTNLLTKPAITRELEPYLRGMEASPAEVNRRAAAEVRSSLLVVREVARLWSERERGCSDVGTSEQIGTVPAGESGVSSSAGLTTREVADRLKVSQRRVVALVTGGSLSAARSGPGHPWLIEEASVTELETTRRSA